VQVATCQDVIVHHLPGHAERGARQLHHPAVRKRMLAERIRETGHALAADDRDFQ
jgi:hypothetical protein